MNSQESNEFMKHVINDHDFRPGIDFNPGPLKPVVIYHRFLHETKRQNHEHRPSEFILEEEKT